MLQPVCRESSPIGMLRSAIFGSLKLGLESVVTTDSKVVASRSQGASDVRNNRQSTSGSTARERVGGRAVHPRRLGRRLRRRLLLCAPAAPDDGRREHSLAGWRGAARRAPPRSAPRYGRALPGGRRSATVAPAAGGSDLRAEWRLLAACGPHADLGGASDWSRAALGWIHLCLTQLSFWNPQSRVRTAVIARPRRCRRMPASISTTARRAVRF